MGKRPKWYLTFLAKIWKLSYIKPSVPILGRLIYKINTKFFTQFYIIISTGDLN